jgi:hypothetical protein
MTLSAFKLSLPTDIPWQKVCVTEDMMDPVVCDPTTSPKWQSSIAVFKFIPDDEYQLFPDVKVTYLKVTVTITGYQPIDDEIQGEIDWDGVDITTIEGLTELLNSYYPCTGAIVQVVVGPSGRNPDLPLDQYPYFMDFEPKKRELYELATDTKEKQSRSFETLNLTKSAGTIQSQEIMDIDMGGGGWGIQASYAGTGGGFSTQGSHGQWGTKSLNSDQSQVQRSAESGTEKRETFSFTTQLSQMYHLLDSYHLGTNRAIFFIQPRPHVLEEPSGFVRGPRKVEGIQEFFLVVGQPKDQEDPFCFSVRLDTGHLIETDILDYDRKSDISDLATATARIPTKNDIPDGTTTREACFIFDCWDITYLCYRTHDVDDQVYQAPAGYIIESIGELSPPVNQTHHGSTSVGISADRKSLNVHAEARGHICFEDSGVCLDCPDEVDKWAGYARRQVRVQLRSEERTVKVGTRQFFLITTRGLCCCEDGPVGPIDIGNVLVTDIWEIPETLGGSFYHAQLSRSVSDDTGEIYPTARYQPKLAMDSMATMQKSDDSCNCNSKAQTGKDGDTGSFERKISIRQANSMIDFTRDRMVRSFSLQRPGYEPKRFIETDLFTRQLGAHVRRSRLGRERMDTKALDQAPRKLVAAVAKHLQKDPKDVTVNDIFHLRPQDLIRLSGMNSKEIARLKIQLLGVPVKGQKPGPGDDAEQQKPRRKSR